MGKILRIETCRDCKKCFINRDYTSDSFETCWRFDCRHEKFWTNGDTTNNGYGKEIARYVDWYEKDPKPPSWCPLEEG